MTGVSPSTTLLLVAVAALVVVLLYRLQDRRRRLDVAFVGLWQAATLESPTRKWRRAVSIGLYLLGVGLLGLALLDPAGKPQDPSTSHLVILLDTSASMAAEEQAETRFAIARNTLSRYLEGLDDSTQVLLTAADAGVMPLLPWTRDRRALTDALRLAQPSDNVSNWRDSLTTVGAYLVGKSHPRLLLVTDGTVADWSSLSAERQLASVPMEAILVGASRYNLGIVAFAARARPFAARMADLMIELQNDHEQTHEVAVEFSSNARSLETQSLTLPAHQRRRVNVADVEVVAHVVQAKLVVLDGPHDGLAIDDSAYALLPEVPKTRVAIVGKGNLYLEAAVLSDDLLVPKLLLPGNAVDPNEVDVAIYDGIDAPQPLLVPSLFIDPPAPSRRLPSGAKLVHAGFDSWNEKSPMLSGLDLYDVQIEHGRQLLPNATDEALALAGNQVIMLRGQRDGKSIAVLGFDPRQSDFVLRPIWPLFVRQVLSELLGRDVANTQVARPFHTVILPAPEAATLATLRGPGGETQHPLQAGRSWSFVPERVGLYTIDTNHRESFIAANLGSVTESRIAPMRPLTYGGREISPPRQRPKPWNHPRFFYFAAAAVLLLLIEWVSFHRRWTV